MFRDLRHDDDGWESIPSFNPPIAKYIHLCNFSTAWDETCKACPDLLSLIGVDQNQFIDFGKKTLSRLQELTFVASGVTYDLTTITSAEVENMFEFRSQQTYVMSDEKNVIFLILEHQYQLLLTEANSFPWTRFKKPLEIYQFKVLLRHQL